MTDDKYKPIPLVALVFVAIIIVFFINTAWGGGTDIEQETEVSVSGDSSKAFGVGGADYDIGQCRYHVGLLTAAWANINEFCQGMELIRAGMVHAGALHICLQSKVGRNYDNLESCMGDFDVTPVIDTSVQDEADDEENEYAEQLEQQQQIHAEDLAELESRVARVESRRPATVKREIIQQPFLSDEKRNALRELKK